MPHTRLLSRSATVLVLVTALLVNLACDRQPNPPSVGTSATPLTFRATVSSVDPLAEYAGTARVCALDPQFVVRFTLAEDVTALAARAGDPLVCAIHSPVVNLGAPADELIGTELTLRFTPPASDRPGDLRRASAATPRDAAAAESQPAAVRQSAAQAQKRIVACYGKCGDALPAADAVVRDWTTPDIWQRLHIQVFTFDMQGYVVSPNEATIIGGAFGGSGLRSVCVSDLDADGRPELLFTHSWGSGLHRSMVGAWCPYRPAEPVDADVAYTSLPDFVLDRRSDQDVAVRVGNDVVGKLQFEITASGPQLRLILRNALPTDIREALLNPKTMTRIQPCSSPAPQ